MKAQIQQNMIDNVKNITDDASAKEYLASTNYQAADSIDAVTEAMVNQTLNDTPFLEGRSSITSSYAQFFQPLYIFLLVS